MFGRIVRSENSLERLIQYKEESKGSALAADYPQDGQTWLSPALAAPLGNAHALLRIGIDGEILQNRFLLENTDHDSNRRTKKKKC